MDQNEALDLLQFKIADEGLPYAILYYSQWNVIEDQKFHELKAKFIEAYEELEDYVTETLGVDC